MRVDDCVAFPRCSDGADSRSAARRDRDEVLVLSLLDFFFPALASSPVLPDPLGCLAEWQVTPPSGFSPRLQFHLTTLSCNSSSVESEPVSLQSRDHSLCRVPTGFSRPGRLSTSGSSLSWAPGPPGSHSFCPAWKCPCGQDSVTVADPGAVVVGGVVFSVLVPPMRGVRSLSLPAMPRGVSPKSLSLS